MIIIGDGVKKAVAYYRHSAEDKQENSIELQREQIEQFAAVHNIRIIAECIDDGISGITADRAGFTRLFEEWVENNDVAFDYVLVLDISRFGRWQNSDESAMYSFKCYMRHRPVINVSRGFPKPGEELLYSLADSIERYTAGKYSKDLCDKVWRGQMKITEQGFSAGGSAPYGLKRVLLDEQKRYLQDLLPGQHKVIANQRVTFAPGDPKQVAVVQAIFEQFVLSAWEPAEIAAWLNDRAEVTATGRPWNAQTIRSILRNDKYAGRTVYNRTSRKLHAEKETHNSRKDWALKNDAFEAVVAPELFDRAQVILGLKTAADHKVVVQSDEVGNKLAAVVDFYKAWLVRRVRTCIQIRQLARSFLLLWDNCVSIGRSQGWRIASDEMLLKVHASVTDLIIPQRLFAG